MVGQKYRLTQDMKDAARALQLPLASSALTLRQIYADAPGQGGLVWRMGAKGKDAAREIEAVFSEVMAAVVPPRAGNVVSMASKAGGTKE
jgi:chromosome partitioning protein